MSTSLPEKIQESYLIIRDSEGWKIMHPEKGMCLLVDDAECAAVSHLTFNNSVVGNIEGGISVLADESGSLKSVKEQLVEDGYTKKQLKEMNVRAVTTAHFTYY